MIKLDGSCGTGSTILNNWDQFDYEFVSREEGILTYIIDFNGTKGYITMHYENEQLGDVTMDCKFPRPLGAYNDPSLYNVAKKILNI